MSETEAKLLAEPDGENISDQLGRSVDVLGDRAVAGAHYKENGGVVYVYDYNGSSWERQYPPITSSDITTGDQFGYTVKLLHDLLFVGARYDDDGGPQTGSVYVFQEQADEPGKPYLEIGKIRPDPPLPSSFFGSALDADGDHVIVGAPDNHTGVGSAYIFSRSDEGWSETPLLLPAEVDAGDHFGHDVAIGGDWAAVGAYKGEEAGHPEVGAVYLYQRDGNTWEFRTRLTHPTPDTGLHPDHADHYGYSVDLSGNVLVVGARLDDRPRDDAPGLWYNASGSVFIYRYDGSTWGLEQNVFGSDTIAYDLLGTTVSVKGNTLIAGAEGDVINGYNNGSFYVFQFDDQTSSWVEKNKTTPWDVAPNDYFSRGLALGCEHIIAGAYQDDDLGSSSGSVYIYTIDESVEVCSPIVCPANR